MPRYEVRVNVAPELHNGQMKYLWQIVQITADGCFAVKHGWSQSFANAMYNASSQSALLSLFIK